VGALLGLVLAAGLLSLERALSRPRSRRRPWDRWWHRRAELLRQAGFGRVRPGALALTEAVTGALLALAVEGSTGAGGLSAAGFVLGALAPSALLRRAARRRATHRCAARLPAGDRPGVRHRDRDGRARRGRRGVRAGVPGDGPDRTVAGRAALR
jgi:hypothetical protein